MKPGEMSKPIKGTQAVFVVSLDEFIEPETKEDYSQQKTYLTNSFNSRASREVYPALEVKAEIEDNRLMYY
jgi:peptidyl-prolyl cis-trans isomerase D